MKLLIDLQACQTKNSANRGVGRYALALSQSIAKLFEGEVVFTANKLYPDEYSRLKWIFRKHAFSSYGYPIDGIFDSNKSSQVKQIASDLIIRHYSQNNPDIVLITNIFEGLGEQAVVPNNIELLHKRGIKVVAVVYDLIPLIMNKNYLSDDKYKAWYLEKVEELKKYDLLLAISDSTKNDLISRLGISQDKIKTIWGSVDTKFRKIEYRNNKTLNKYGIKEDYVLYTGGGDFRKNIEGLVKGYSELNEEIIKKHQLVIVCALSEQEKARLLEYTIENGIDKNQVVFTGFVSDEELVELYNRCCLFVFPSVYEGLGLPIIEAMKCGVPVVGANNSSIKEIIMKEDALFDAENLKSVVDVITKALTDNVFCANLCKWSTERSKDFSWNSSGKLAVKALKELNKQSETEYHVPEKRMKIAFVSPLPPQQSGIADYSAELLPYLHKYVDIDLYTDAIEVQNDYINENLKVFLYTELEEQSNNYDAIIYQVGNSSFHDYMYELLMKCPGIVVLHDFFISGMVNDFSMNWKNKEKIFEQELFYSHGYKGINYLRTYGLGDTIAKFPVNKRVLDNAEALIFHSPYLRKLESNFYNNTIATQSFVIKHLRKLNERVISTERTKIREQLGYKETDFLIVSFGFVTEFKLGHKLVEAISNLPKEYKCRVKIVFAGGIGQEKYAQELKKIISEFALQDRIVFTGYIDRRTYKNYMEIADIAVQLRTNTRGETSGAILDCLSYGIPTIVNAYATFNDYPDNVVVKIAESVSVEELTLSIEKLVKDETYRLKVSKTAVEYLTREHNPDAIAQQYMRTIEYTTDKNKCDSDDKLILEIKKDLGIYAAREQLKKIATWSCHNRPILNKKNIAVIFPHKELQLLFEKNEKVEQSTCDFIPAKIEKERSLIAYNYNEQEHTLYFTGRGMKIDETTLDAVVVSTQNIDDDSIKKIKGLTCPVFAFDGDLTLILGKEKVMTMELQKSALLKTVLEQY